MNKNKGFTLIELLVVIAIIVILASIVLVGIQSATKKAKDARITADISQIRTQAEVFFSTNNTYIGMDANAEITKLSQDITAQGSSATINASENNYCVYAQLIEPTTVTYQCVDSAGNATRTISVSTCTETSWTCQ